MHHKLCRASNAPHFPGFLSSALPLSVRRGQGRGHVKFGCCFRHARSFVVFAVVVVLLLLVLVLVVAVGAVAVDVIAVPLCTFTVHVCVVVAVR